MTSLEMERYAAARRNKIGGGDKKKRGSFIDGGEGGGIVISPNLNIPGDHILQAVPGARFAISPRQVSASYNGPCVKARRPSDNAMMDLNFINGVLDTASISAWSGGANPFIATIYDQSGSGDTFTQTNQNEQATLVLSSPLFNGLPAFYFPKGGPNTGPGDVAPTGTTYLGSTTLDTTAWQNMSVMMTTALDPTDTQYNGGPFGGVVWGAATLSFAQDAYNEIAPGVYYLNSTGGQTPEGLVLQSNNWPGIKINNLVYAQGANVNKGFENGVPAAQIEGTGGRPFVISGGPIVIGDDVWEPTFGQHDGPLRGYLGDLIVWPYAVFSADDSSVALALAQNQRIYWKT